MKCKCNIDCILGKEKTKTLTTLLNILGKEFTNHTLLAKIKPLSAKSLDCEFIHSWGLSYYCSNRDVIIKFQAQ
jgi:hypothetical protein